MKKMTINQILFRQGLCLILTLLVAFSNSSLAQSNKSWTTVGSAGTVNDDDVSNVSLLGGGIAALSNTAPASTTAIIRYNVVAVDGLLVTGFPKMTVRYQDNGANAQVRVCLWEYDFTTPQLTQVLCFDSNDFGSSGSLQTQSTEPCDDAGFSFDFTHKAYYLEAQLIRTAATGFPKLATVHLSSVDVNCNQ
ncbi:MAG: hypothetical protein AB1489_20865 [Acidobacteriota bacterium]